MIVPDGRTDPEKLRQLLVAAEETHLDFKASVNSPQDEGHRRVREGRRHDGQPAARWIHRHWGR